MISAVKEYVDVYKEFLQLCNQEKNSSDLVNNLKQEIATLEGSKKSVDYNDVNVVTSYMEQYIQSETEKTEQGIVQQVNQEVQSYSHPNTIVMNNYNDVCSSLGFVKANGIVDNTSMNFAAPIDIKKAEDASGFKFAKTLDNIYYYVFRLGFLGNKLNRVLRIIIGIVLWLIIISVLGSVMQIGKNSLAGVVVYYIFILLLIASNIAIPIIHKSSAKGYLISNLGVCKAIRNPDLLREQMIEYRINEYRSTVVAGMNHELEFIRNNGLPSVSDDNQRTISSVIMADLEKQYNVYCEQIKENENKIKELQNGGEIASEKVDEFRPKVIEKEKKLIEIPAVDQNEGVITPYVPLGFESIEHLGTKNLLYIEHDCRPIVIRYNKPSLDEEDRFRKNIARIVEQFMMGFLHENYYENIKMTLIDFESLHFPESRTKGFMNVIRSREEVTKFFAELKDTRDKVNSIGNGRISSINSEKTKIGENTIEYNIAFFVGYDFDSLNKEDMQLFIGGENFGFVPIIFMETNEVDDYLNEEVASKEFDKVINKAFNGKNIGTYEVIIESFTYDVVVTNYIDDVDEKLCVVNLMNYEEFNRRIEEEDGIEFVGKLYAHVKDIDKDQYDYLFELTEERDQARYFIFDGEEVPSFVDKDKLVYL